MKEASLPLIAEEKPAVFFLFFLHRVSERERERERERELKDWIYAASMEKKK